MNQQAKQPYPHYSILIYCFSQVFFFFSLGVPQVFFQRVSRFCQVDNAKALKVADEEAMHHEAMKDVTVTDFFLGRNRSGRSRVKRGSQVNIIITVYTVYVYIYHIIYIYIDVMI